MVVASEVIARPDASAGVVDQGSGNSAEGRSGQSSAARLPSAPSDIRAAISKAADRAKLLGDFEQVLALLRAVLMIFVLLRAPCPWLMVDKFSFALFLPRDFPKHFVFRFWVCFHGLRCRTGLRSPSLCASKGEKSFTPPSFSLLGVPLGNRSDFWKRGRFLRWTCPPRLWRWLRDP